MTRLNQKQEHLLKELLKDFKDSAEDLLGKGGLIKQITKRALEAVLEGEMTDHLGYEAHDASGRGSEHWYDYRVPLLCVTTRICRCKLFEATTILRYRQRVNLNRFT